MTKDEKQKLMIDGAVFEHGSSEYFFDGAKFLDSNCERFAESIFYQMTLKTPPPEPEYSREFVEMGTIKMMELMIKGLILQMDNMSLVKLDVAEKNNPYRIKVGGSWLSFGGWDGPCRVYQEPKEETRYRFAYKSEQYPDGRMDGGYHLDEDSFKSTKDVMVYDVKKMECYSKQFPLDCQCNGKCPKCCKE